MVRNILAVIAGLAVGMAVHLAVLVVSFVVYPLPEGIDTSDSAAMAAYISGLPAPAFVLAWLAHAGGTFAGALTAAAISKSAKLTCALVIGVFYLVGGILNVMQLPHPVAFAVIDLLSYLPAAWLGYWLVRGSGKRSAKSETPA